MQRADLYVFLDDESEIRASMTSGSGVSNHSLNIESKNLTTEIVICEGGTIEQKTELLDNLILALVTMKAAL